MPSPSGFREAESERGHKALSRACPASGSNPDTPTKKEDCLPGRSSFLLYFENPRPLDARKSAVIVPLTI